MRFANYLTVIKLLVFLYHFLKINFKWPLDVGKSKCKNRGNEHEWLNIHKTIKYNNMVLIYCRNEPNWNNLSSLVKTVRICQIRNWNILWLFETQVIRYDDKQNDSSLKGIFLLDSILLFSVSPGADYLLLNMNIWLKWSILLSSTTELSNFQGNEQLRVESQSSHNIYNMEWTQQNTTDNDANTESYALTCTVLNVWWIPKWPLE